MKKEKLGQSPAFPTKPQNVVIGHETYTYKDEDGKDCVGSRNIFGEVQSDGISKRFYAACIAMQGLLSCNASYEDGEDCERLIADAYRHADEILKQEHE